MVYSSSIFDSDVFDAEAAVVAVSQGLLLKMRPVPYRGPETGARVISPREIRRARRKFREREDEFILFGEVA